MKSYWTTRIIKIIFLVLLAGVVFSYAVMLLWNVLVPELFHGPHITWLQAIGILILSKILFGGKGGGWHRHGWKHYGNHLKEKMKNMTPEEKEKFRRMWQEKCGRWMSPMHEDEKE